MDRKRCPKSLRSIGQTKMAHCGAAWAEETMRAWAEEVPRWSRRPHVTPLSWAPRVHSRCVLASSSFLCHLSRKLAGGAGGPAGERAAVLSREGMRSCVLAVVASPAVRPVMCSRAGRAQLRAGSRCQPSRAPRCVQPCWSCVRGWRRRAGWPPRMLLSMRGCGVLSCVLVGARIGVGAGRAQLLRIGSRLHAIRRVHTSHRVLLPPCVLPRASCACWSC